VAAGELPFLTQTAQIARDVTLVKAVGIGVPAILGKVDAGWDPVGLRVGKDSLDSLISCHIFASSFVGLR
jgi:hypothetical protein